VTPNVLDAERVVGEAEDEVVADPRDLESRRRED
jgi:hypothetical protein